MHGEKNRYACLYATLHSHHFIFYNMLRSYPGLLDIRGYGIRDTIPSIRDQIRDAENGKRDTPPYLPQTLHRPM